MKKIRKTTLIHLPHGNHAKCPIYEHEGKYYIKSNKRNTSSYEPLRLNGQEYSEIVCIDLNTKREFWHKK